VVVGIVGCGGMGQVHASKYVQMPDVRLVAFDQDAERLDGFAKRYGAEKATGLDELLDRAEAADVCLPTPLHVPVGLKCLDAGLSVLMEKPMASSLAECRILVERARNGPGRLMPAQVVRFFPEFEKSHDIVTHGEIGRVASVRTRRGGAAPKSPWYLDLSQSGGVLLDLAVHDFDWLLWTLGPARGVVAGSAGAAGLIRSGLGDHSLTVIEFESGAVAHVESTWLDPSGFRVAMDIAGSRGVLQYDSRDNPPLRCHRRHGSRTENNYMPADDPYFRQASAFLEAVRTGQEFPVTAEEGAAAVAVAEAAMKSAGSGLPSPVESL
jgi:predicted dehydrogenase